MTRDAHSSRASDLGLERSDTSSSVFEPPAWLEELLDALCRDDFNAIVNRFAERECHAFFVAGESFTLKQTEIHRGYQRLFESRIEAHLRAHGISHQRFVDALTSWHEHSDGSSSGQTEDTSLLQLLQMIEDFESFAAMMTQRAFEKDTGPT